MDRSTKQDTADAPAVELRRGVYGGAQKDSDLEDIRTATNEPKDDEEAPEVRRPLDRRRVEQVVAKTALRRNMLAGCSIRRKECVRTSSQFHVPLTGMINKSSQRAH